MPLVLIKIYFLIEKKKNNNEIKCIPNYFPTIDRFINDQIVLNYINFKKRKFENLKNMIEY